MSDRDEFNTCLSDFLSPIEFSELRVRGFIANETLYQRLKTRLKVHGVKFSTRDTKICKGTRLMLLNDNSVYSGHVYSVEKSCVKHCCRGPLYYKNKDMLPVPEHPPTKKQRQGKITIKQNCPAIMTVKKIKIYPNYKLTPGNNSWRHKRKLIEKCQANKDAAKTIVRYEVEMSTAAVHNHSLTPPKVDLQQVHTDVVEVVPITFGTEDVDHQEEVTLIAADSIETIATEDVVHAEVVDPVQTYIFNVKCEDALEVSRKQILFRELCQQMINKSYHCFNENCLDNMIVNLSVMNVNMEVVRDHYT